MTRAATPRFAGSVAFVAAAWLAAMPTGRIEILLLGVPFALSIAWSALADRRALLDAALSLDTDRCLEGESVEASIAVTSTGRADDVLVGLRLPPGSRSADGPVRSGTVAPGKPLDAIIGFVAGAWGVHRVGPVALRSYGPGRLFYDERADEHSAGLEVYPAFQRMRRGIVPPRTQVFTGNYVSRVAGEGIEFAEVREFVPGDQIRRVNWRVSSRRQQLSVNVAHQERNADVVIVIDTFARIGPRGRTSLDLSVTAAAALARHYLGHRDRVGLVTFGGMLAWLGAAAGRRQLHRIVGYLLKVDVSVSYAWKDIDTLPYRTIPPQALVVACTPLVDRRMLRALVDLDARGFPVTVVDTLAEDAVPAGPSTEDRLAHRVWRLEREATRVDLTSRGIAVVAWDGSGDLEEALVRLPRRPRVVRR
ncbi:MAG: DUF58 domain-containing protein [Actinomycetota bacterium]|nr:DUF58 domain-containing protein [Actinomycetota bacterium]